MWWITFVAVVVVIVMPLRATKTSLMTDKSVPPSGIGASFYLPDHSITDVLGHGYNIFSMMSAECVVENRPKTNTEKLNIYDSAQSFYMYAANEVGLKSSEAYPHTFYTSLVTVSESTDTANMDIIGIAIDITAVSYSYTLTPDCAHSLPLVQSFEEAFKKLPTRIIKPYEKNGWIPYKVFLETYGTHYQKSIKYGSRILEYIFAKRSRGYTKDQMLVEVCRRFQKVSMSLCNEVTKEDYDNAKRLITSSFFDVRGGNSTTRSALTIDITQKDLEDFLQQADQHDQAIQMTMEPIWELLKKRFMGSEHFNKALTLEQYYTGYIATGCSYYVGDDGIEMRMFDVLREDQYIVEYGCKLRKLGCRTDNDCHLGAMSWSCFCYGSSCVDRATYFNPALGQIKTREIRKTEQGTTWEGVNLSCHYKFGPGCYCERIDTEWDVTWPSSSNEIKHNIEIYRQLYKTLQNKGLSSSRTSTRLSLTLLGLAMFWLYLIL